MLTAAINDTMPPNTGSGQVADTKANTEEFGLIMAAMQMLPMPGPSVSPQIQEESGGVKPPSAGMDSLELFTSLLPEGVKEDASGQKPLAGLQGLSPPAGLAVHDSGKDAAQMPDGAQPSFAMPAAQAVMAAQNQENMPGMAGAVTVQSVPQQSGTAQNSGQMTMKKAGFNQAVENGVEQGGTPALAQKNTAVFPVGGETKAVVSERQAVPGTSLSGNILQTAQTGNSNVSVIRMKGEPAARAVENGVEQGSAPALAQKNTAVFPVGGETKAVVSERQAVPGTSPSGNVMPTAQTENSEEMSLKTGGPDKIEPLKSGSGTEFACAVENSPRPNAPAETVLPAAGFAESPRGVALPDLNERLTQEIRNVLIPGKGEQQRQFQLKLEPEHLGRLTVKLFFDGDALSAHFYTGNNHVKEILEGSLQQLRDSLSQQDLRLDQALVFAGDDGRGGGMGRSFEERNGQAWLAHTGYYNHTYQDAKVDPVNLLTVTTDSARVNYLI